MSLNPYLTFDGRCKEAFEGYQTILGGEIVAMIAHEGTPAADHVPAEWRRKIIHARLIGKTACCSWDQTRRQTAMNR